MRRWLVLVAIPVPLLSMTTPLKPSAFPDLPAAVREYLDRRGCQIPQSFLSSAPHNVVRGRFTSASGADIAVLCSMTKVSIVLVFPGGKTSNVLEVAQRSDDGFRQTVGKNGVVRYSRALGVASPSYIREHYAAYGGPKPPPLAHDGINDMFLEKASVVWYWYRGHWLQLTGAN